MPHVLCFLILQAINRPSKCRMIGHSLSLAAQQGPGKPEQIKMIMIYPKCTSGIMEVCSTPGGNCGAHCLNVCKVDWGICSTVIEHMPVFPPGHMYNIAHKSLLYEPARSHEVIKSRQLAIGKDNLTHSLNQLRLHPLNCKIEDYNFTTGQCDWHHHQSQMASCHEAKRAKQGFIMKQTSPKHE